MHRQARLAYVSGKTKRPCLKTEWKTAANICPYSHTQSKKKQNKAKIQLNSVQWTFFFQAHNNHGV